MKYFHKSIPALLIIMGCTSLFFGCGPKKPEKVTCPFTEITWENTLEEVQALEGEAIESYASIYDGMTYSYSKEYDGMDGTIKYMFDDEEKLMCMAWLYIPEDAKDLDEVYIKLKEQTEDLYGKSGFSSSQLGAKGDVWYLEDGNILIGVMSTGINEAVQYQFFHPDVSSEKPIQSSNK